MSFLTKLFGDPNKKMLVSLQLLVDHINALEPEFVKLSAEELKNKTADFKERLKQGEILDNLLPEAFAAVREASKRTTGMRHFDVQLIGGMALHRAQIAEMRTGEGKTLVATLPIYLNALEGQGVHLVTVNDYLARRDAVWMGQIYAALGMTVGVIQNLRVSYVYDEKFKEQETGNKEQGANELDKERDELGSFKVEYDFLRPASRQEAYRCDITYGTNNEFGFDYLRDNMVQSISEMVMRPGDEMHYGIVDEIDSILIDEARTPLIISAPAEEAAEQYYQFAKLVRQLKENEDYNVDEKLRSVTLTESGIAKFEKWLGVENIYAEGGIRLVHHIEQALKAEVLFKRDRDYIVEASGEVVIIDEFTGRKMPGRRYSEGLHQAIEAKEGVQIQRESQTLATITFQNFFRMYKKLAGMTGTAVTEAEEFSKIYNLEVVVIPTNRPDIRRDHPDRIYKTESAKFRAVMERIKECQTKGQPILVGTISVEKNEQLGELLTRAGVKHEILNAKNHEREGEIIAQAGRVGAVTLATNMAGRGVDIKLGGVPATPEEIEKVKSVGGLFVLGTERHEARRIDNQLRGRSGRQGDSGETQFLVSTEDDLMRIFAGDRLKSVMTRLNVPEDMPIEQRLITKLLESAQKKVEGFHFDTRKHLLEYDDVLNRHRGVIYKKRREILELDEGQLSPPTPYEDGEMRGVDDDSSQAEKQPTTLKSLVLDMVEQEIEFMVSYHTNTEDRGDWDLAEIAQTVKTIFPLTVEEEQNLLAMGKRGEKKLDEAAAREAMVSFLLEKARQEYEKVAKHVAEVAGHGEESNKLMREIEKSVLLRSIDTLWVEHLVSIDYLRTGIGLRGYGQRDPLVEYKKEAFHLFNELQTNIQKEVVYSFYKVGLGLQLAPQVMAALGPTVMASDKLVMKGATKETSVNGAVVKSKPRDEFGHKVGRNHPCPCGSGKKFKKCHGP